MKNYFLDISAFIKVLERIEQDDRVLYFNKHSTLAIIDLYFDSRICLDLLNRICASILDRKKGGNWVYASLEKAMIFRRKEITVTSFKKQLELLSEQNFLEPIKILMNFFISSTAKEMKIDKTEVENGLFIYLSGDLRKLEKSLFDNFYTGIVLKKDFQSKKLPSGGIGRPTAEKKELLFDLFPLLFPKEEFYPQEKIENTDVKNSQIYDNSYYRYKINKVKTIIGK